MNPIGLLLKLFIFFMLVFFVIKTGFRFLFWILSLWYITIPLAVVLYLLLFWPRSKQVRQKNKDNLDPTQEIKLDKEPKFRDLDSDSQKREGEE